MSTKAGAQVIAISFLWLWAWAASAGTVTVGGHAAGPTPFIARLDLTVTRAATLKSVEFTVMPRPGSVVRPIRAKYSRGHLEDRGLLDLETGELTLPVFGLYADFENTVQLKAAFENGSGRRLTVTVPTAAWVDPSGIYLNPTVVRERSADKLSFDYILLKGFVGGISPIIIDTDGEVRWVGTAGASSQPAILHEGGIYVARGTTIVRMELDGTFTDLEDYADQSVIGFHHNFDVGKRGILAQVDTVDAIESVIIEIDGAGQPLQTWDMNQIFRAHMLAGGDDPNGLVQDGVDWFHSNATTYDKRTDSLIVSSRESFVVALDYETGEIRWLLGDPTKSWFQFASLRSLALELGPGTLPPIGQHALSTRGNTLLLFDNGANSQAHDPAGEARDYSAARRYRISAKKKIAKETFTYLADPSISSPFCSSIYEDKRHHYLLNYTLAGPFVSTEILGLTPNRRVAFQYSYPIVAFCGVAWNASPIHLEKLKFR